MSIMFQTSVIRHACTMQRFSWWARQCVYWAWVTTRLIRACTPLFDTRLYTFHVGGAILSLFPHLLYFNATVTQCIEKFCSQSLPCCSSVSFNKCQEILPELKLFILCSYVPELYLILFTNQNVFICWCVWYFSGYTVNKTTAGAMWRITGHEFMYQRELNKVIAKPCVKRL